MLLEGTAMNAAKPKTNVSQQVTPPPAPAIPARRHDSVPPPDSQHATAPTSDDFERHDTIPAPTWFDEAIDPAN